MLFKLPNRFEAGELADPVKLNENFGYVQSAINGNLDANNLAKTARIARTGIKNIWTPSALTFYLDARAAGVGTTAEYVFPASTDGHTPTTSVIFDHAEFLVVDAYTTSAFDDGRSYFLAPIRASDAIAITIQRNGTDIWRTTYDVSASGITYVWPHGQFLNNLSGYFAANDVLGVSRTAGSTVDGQFLCVRVWLYWPQADVAASSPALNTLTRNILPPELD